jgi:penicillin G amidase
MTCIRTLGLCLVLSTLPSCALYKLATKGQSYPQLKGSLPVPGIEAPIDIKRDQYGIPHIQAQTERDAWFGLGFVHGQDRLFQVDTRRRYAFGQLSEWIGSSTVELDGFMRGLDLKSIAEQIVENATPEVREMLEAYAHGLNAGADSLANLPIEYRLLSLSFEPWTPSDCAAIVLIQSWSLSENPHFELGALALKDHLTPDQIDKLFRHEPNIPALDSYFDEIAAARFGDYTTGFKAFDGPPSAPTDPPPGSNNWVIGPEKSVTKAPIMASDPHLVQSVPSLWYIAHVQGGDLNVAGVTLPSAPAIVIGHNEHLAWSLTNIMADYVDFVALERSGERGYILAGETRELQTKTAEIKVKGGQIAQRDTHWTEVGPVVTELSGTHLLAMRWHALELADETATIFHDLNLASSVEEAVQVSSRPSSVAQHLLLADDQGHIGLAQLGTLVERRGFTGRVPYPGSSAEYGWDGWIEERFVNVDPDAGYLHTANANMGYPRSNDISSAYLPAHRHDRIDELLRSKETFSAAEMAAMQLDRRDHHAATRLPELLDGVSPSTDPGKKCAELLTAWDYTWETDSVGATVWAVFQRELLREALSDEIGPQALEVYFRVSGSSRSLIGNGIEPFLADRAQAVDGALEATCTSLSASAGPDPSDWTWGAHHPLRLEHVFASGRKLLSGWNMPEAPYGGSGSTIAAAGYGWRVEDTEVGGMASMRMVMPLDSPSHATVIHPGGQSGQPGHPHYKDLFQPYVDGQNVPLWFDPKAIEKEATRHLRLEPLE